MVNQQVINIKPLNLRKEKKPIASAREILFCLFVEYRAGLVMPSWHKRADKWKMRSKMAKVKGNSIKWVAHGTNDVWQTA